MRGGVCKEGHRAEDCGVLLRGGLGDEAGNESEGGEVPEDEGAGVYSIKVSNGKSHRELHVCNYLACTLTGR